MPNLLALPPTGKIFIGMDIAASEFCKDGKYDLDFKNPESKPEDWITSDQLAEMYQGFIKDYPVLSIEDPFDQVCCDDIGFSTWKL